MNVLFHKKFDKRFAKMSASIQKKAVGRIQLFQTNPFDKTLNNHALTGRWTGYRSIDVTGDYRAIYLPVNDNLAKFYTVDTHSNLYS